MSGVIGNLTGATAAKQAKDMAAQQQATELARQQAITSGTQNINSTFDSQFTPTYYNNIKQGYLDNATPQLDDQYKTAQERLTYGLARSGQLDSSSAAKQAADLQKQYDDNAQSVAGNAQQIARTQQSNVEGARAGLISALNSTGNTAEATNSAAAQAAALSQPVPFSPLGQLFGATTSTLAQAANADRNAALMAGAAYTSPFSYVGKPASAANAIKVT